MGQLYDAAQSQNQMKRNFVLGKLIALEVTNSHHGQSIELLDYDDLKYELVLAEYKEINATSDANKWFQEEKQMLKIIDLNTFAKEKQGVDQVAQEAKISLEANMIYIVSNRKLTPMILPIGVFGETMIMWQNDNAVPKESIGKSKNQID